MVAQGRDRTAPPQDAHNVGVCPGEHEGPELQKELQELARRESPPCKCPRQEHHVLDVCVGYNKRLVTNHVNQR
eukprot:4088617-Pyramimonas_sp.AAC.1